MSLELVLSPSYNHDTRAFWRGRARPAPVMPAPTTSHNFVLDAFGTGSRISRSVQWRVL
ncbi:hypothetical protein BD626DRAFT_486496, partial [Schizophyllum amplum]